MTDKQRETAGPIENKPLVVPHPVDTSNGIDEEAHLAVLDRAPRTNPLLARIEELPIKERKQQYLLYRRMISGQVQMRTYRDKVVEIMAAACYPSKKAVREDGTEKIIHYLRSTFLLSDGNVMAGASEKAAEFAQELMTVMGGVGPWEESIKVRVVEVPLATGHTWDFVPVD